MSDNPFENIDEYFAESAPRSTAKRKASPAARQAAAKRRKPSLDRYRMPDSCASPANSAPSSNALPSRKQNKQRRNTMSAEAMMQQKAKSKPKSDASLLQRIIFFFRANSPMEIWMAFLSWIARHPYIVFLIAVIFIAIGMLVSRYISVAGSIVLIFFGALLSKEDYDTAGYCCYAAAFMDFIIPYII